MNKFTSLLSHTRELFRRDNESLAALMAKGTSGTFLLKLASTGIIFLTSVLLARWLGIASFGEYTYVMSWVSLLSIPAKLGFEQTVPRFTAKYLHQNDPNNIRGIIQFSTGIVLLASLICMGLAGVCAWILKDNSPLPLPVFWIALILLPLYALRIPFSGFLTGLHKVVSAQFPSLFITPFVFIILIVIGQWYRPAGISPLGVFLLQISANSVGLGFAVALAWPSLSQTVRNSVAHYEGMLWLKSALPITLMTGMYVINMNADIIMLGTLRDVDAAGVYKVATRGADLIMLITVMISAALGPIVSRLHSAGDIARLQRGITKSTRIAVLLGLPLCFGLIFFGEQFLSLFGKNFMIGHEALIILSMAQLIAITAGPSRVVLIMTGQERAASAGLTFSTLLNVSLNYLLIPLLGINGAALATAISLLVAHLIAVRFVWKLLHINPTILAICRSRI